MTAGLFVRANNTKKPTKFNVAKLVTDSPVSQFFPW